jgi:hypothetical protein
MMEIDLREGKSNRCRHRLVIAATVCALFASKSESFAYDGPVVRSGLWKFERTLETDGKRTDRLQTSGLLIDREMTRCVNPTAALKLEFAPLQFGTCSAKDVRKTDEGYVFLKVCAGTATPIKTEINVESDSAYIEINQGTIGKIASKETLVARRVGDCHPSRK